MIQIIFDKLSKILIIIQIEHVNKCSELNCYKNIFLVKEYIDRKMIKRRQMSHC